jgi:hypothetical protein
VIVYREQKEGNAGDEVKVSLGTVLHVANQTETKMLMSGKKVEAVLFKIGSNLGGFWMPKSEFEQSKEPHDVKTQTGISYQHKHAENQKTFHFLVLATTPAGITRTKAGNVLC